MHAPKRRITVAERDRALRLRRNVTTSSAVMGTLAVAAVGLIAAHTTAGTSTTSDSSSSMTTTSTTTTPSPSSSSSSSLSTGSASTGSASSASTVTGGS
jgi:hypothetical protein